jgi:hypothetical protein
LKTEKSGGAHLSNREFDMANRPGTFSRRVGDLFAGLRRVREEEFPYITRFTGAAVPQSLPKLSDFPGLISLQSAEAQNGEIEIIAYWKSYDAARKNERKFEKSLKIGSPRFMGYLRDVIISKKAWWQRIPVGRWLLYSASIFGAVTVLQTHFAKLSEVPDAVVEIPGPSSLKFLAGDEVDFDATITNRSREVYAKATLSMPKLKDSKGTIVDHKFRFNPKPAPIAPSDVNTVSVEGSPLTRGRYTVTVIAEVEAGFLRDSLRFPAEKSLQIWSREPVTEGLSSTRTEEGLGRLSGRILVGMDAPDGLSCQVTIERRPGIKISLIDFPGVRTWEDPVAAAGVTSVKFRSSRHFTGFSTIPFEITVDASSRTENWNTISLTSTVDCEIVEKEGK